MELLFHGKGHQLSQESVKDASIAADILRVVLFLRVLRRSLSWYKTYLSFLHLTCCSVPSCVKKITELV